MGLDPEESHQQAKELGSHQFGGEEPLRLYGTVMSWSGFRKLVLLVVGGRSQRSNNEEGISLRRPLQSFMGEVVGV